MTWYPRPLRNNSPAVWKHHPTSQTRNKPSLRRSPWRWQESSTMNQTHPDARLLPKVVEWQRTKKPSPATTWPDRRSNVRRRGAKKTWHKLMSEKCGRGGNLTIWHDHTWTGFRHHLWNTGFDVDDVSISLCLCLSGQRISKQKGLNSPKP